MATTSRGEREREQQQHEADDAELAERLEVERVRVLDRRRERPVRRPPVRERACSAAVDAARVELVERRAPELPAAAARAAQQVRLHVVAVRDGECARRLPELVEAPDGMRGDDDDDRDERERRRDSPADRGARDACAVPGRAAAPRRSPRSRPRSPGGAPRRSSFPTTPFARSAFRSTIATETADATPVTASATRADQRRGVRSTNATTAASAVATAPLDDVR